MESVKQLREAFKVAGYSNRKIRVTGNYYYNTVEIKSATVNPFIVDQVISDTTTMSTNTQYSFELEQELTSIYSTKITEIVKQAQLLENGSGQNIKNSEYIVSHDDNSRFSIWGRTEYGSTSRIVDCGTIEQPYFMAVAQVMHKESFSAPLDERIAQYKKEDEQQEKEYLQREKDRKESAKLHKIEKNKIDAIFSSVKSEKVSNLEIKNGLYAPNMNKMGTIAEYQKQMVHAECHTVNAVVSEVVTLTVQQYECFIQNFLRSFDFIAKKGGSSLLDSDPRIKEFAENENWYGDKELLEYYRENSFVDVIKVRCSGKQNLYINPEGFSYARYVYF